MKYRYDQVQVYLFCYSKHIIHSFYRKKHKKKSSTACFTLMESSGGNFIQIEQLSVDCHSTVEHSYPRHQRSTSMRLEKVNLDTVTVNVFCSEIYFRALC